MSDVGLSGPRGLSRSEAARRCGLTVSGFSTWVAKRIVPGPMPGTHRWDAKALDAALDKLSGLTPTQAPTLYEIWKQARAARKT